MKNCFTKLLAGLLAVMMLMSSSVAFMEEMPEAQDTVVEETAPTVDVEEQVESTEDAAEPDMGDASESASDDAAEPAPNHATEPASDDAQEPDADVSVPDENIEEADAVISSEPVDAIVEESEDTDLSMLEAQDIDDELDLDALEDDITDDNASAMLMEPTGGTIDLNNSEVIPDAMLMYGKEASNRKQEIDRQHYTIPNQRPKDKHCGKI